jgi:hypothetical protein
MNTAIEPRLVDFLQQELQIPADAIAVALGHEEHARQLPMILWQYGLVTLSQLDKIFEWLATV